MANPRLARAVLSVVALVPPRATVTGAVSENCVPLNVRPVPAVQAPAPANWVQVIAVEPSVPPGSEVQAHCVSAASVPRCTTTKAPGTCVHAAMSLARAQAPEADT